MSIFTTFTSSIKDAGKKVSNFINRKSDIDINKVLDEYQEEIYNLYFRVTYRMITNLVSHIEIVNEYNTISDKLDQLSNSIINKKTQEYYKKNFIPLKLKDRKSKILVYQKEIVQCKDSAECMVPKGDLKTSIEKSFELYSLFKKYINLEEEHNIIRSHINTNLSLESYILDGIEELLDEIYLDKSDVAIIKKNDNTLERYISLENLMTKYTSIETYRNLILEKKDDIVEIKNAISNSNVSSSRELISELKNYNIYKSSENNTYISIKFSKTNVEFIEPKNNNYKMTEYDIANMETYSNFYTTQFNPQFLFKNDSIHSVYYKIYSQFVNSCQWTLSKKNSLNYKNDDLRELSCILHQYLSRYYSNMSSIVQNTTRNTKIPSSLLSNILEDFTIDEIYSEMESGRFSYNRTKLGNIFTLDLKSVPIGFVYLPNNIENAKYIYHDAMVTMKLFNDFGDSDIADYIHYCLDLFYCGIDLEKTKFAKNTICKVPYNITTFSIKTYNDYITLGYYIDQIIDTYPILVLDIVTNIAIQLCKTQKTILKKYRTFCHGSVDMDNILLLPLDSAKTHNKYNQIANQNNFLFTGYYNSIVIDKYDTLYANKIDNRKDSELENMATSGSYKNILAIYDILYFLSVVRTKLVNKNIGYREVYEYLFTVLDELAELGPILDCFNGSNIDFDTLKTIENIPSLDKLSDALEEYRKHIVDSIPSEMEHFTTNQEVKKMNDCAIGFDRTTGEQLDYNYRYPICKDKFLINIIDNKKKSICEKKDTLDKINIGKKELSELDTNLRYITNRNKSRITFGTPYPENYSEMASEFIEELDSEDCE